MAIESQGVQVLRIGTAAGDTVSRDATGLAVTATGIVDANATANFITGGWTTGMRVVVNSTAGKNDGRVFILKSVAATVMGFYTPAATADDNTGIVIEGAKYYAVGEVTGFSGPTGSVNVIDVTNLASTAKEKKIGIRDEGQLTLDCNLNVDATYFQIALKNDRASRTKRQYEIVLTDRATVAAHVPSWMNFDAYVTGFSLTGSVDNVVKASITLEISSAVKWMSGGS